MFTMDRMFQEFEHHWDTSCKNWSSYNEKLWEKKDLESKGKFDETSFSLDVNKLQSNYWSCVILD